MSTFSRPATRTARLKKLIRLMNGQGERYIPPISQIVDLLDYDITDPELDFLLKLGSSAREDDDIIKLSGLGAGPGRALFEGLVRKGFLAPETGETVTGRWQLTPVVVGWLEFQLMAGQDTARTLDFARRLEDLFQTGLKYNVFPLRHLGNFIAGRFMKPNQSVGPVGRQATKTIPIDRRVDHPPSTVYPISDAYELVDRHGAGNQVSLVHCFCRRFRQLMNDPCRFDLPAESCIAVGPMAEHLNNYGFGRKIDKNDALKILEEMARGGAIHTLFHEKDDISLPNVAVCNCCWDCCGLLGSYNRGIISLSFKSHYLAKIKKPESCKACRKCEKHCPSGAITVQEDKPVINEKICLGCGQCILQCPTDTLELTPLTRDAMLPLIKKSKARLAS